MTTNEINSWKSIQSEVLNRISNREWKPGELIPKESDLAIEFNCARATVNRALRELAEGGLLDRRRKAGTRVALHPVRKATLDISVIRKEIEERGHAYSYTLIEQKLVAPPINVCARMNVDKQKPLLNIRCVHIADGRPYVTEDRWINQNIIPEANDADFSILSPNEWLVLNVPFSGSDITFSAATAGLEISKILNCHVNESLFIIDRTTWNRDTAVTSVQLAFAQGYRMRTKI